MTISNTAIPGSITETKDESEGKRMVERSSARTWRRSSSLTGYLPRYGNQAIKFTGDDMGGDKVMVEVLLWHHSCHHGDYLQLRQTG
ncbi:MAG: hypothetical protein ACLTZM_02530 [Ruminococcus sp.]